jgi:hypothetical protein
MKTNLVAVAILVSGISLTLNAAPLSSVIPGPSIKVSGFGAFHAHRQHNAVALAWNNSSSNVMGYAIQHSFDGFNFVTIDQVSPETGGWNNYCDQNALPGFNHYRIVAQLTSGEEYSEVKVVRIVRRK